MVPTTGKNFGGKVSIHIAGGNEKSKSQKEKKKPPENSIYVQYLL